LSYYNSLIIYNHVEEKNLQILLERLM